MLLIDATVSPAGNGWVTLGSAARASYAFGVDAYAPASLAKVNRYGTEQLDRALAEECPAPPNRPAADVVNPYAGG